MPVRLTSVTTNVSPTCPRSTGPGTCPLNVHMSWVTPGATCISLSSAASVTWCTVPDGAGASTGLTACQPGGGAAPGSMTASGAADPAGFAGGTASGAAAEVPGAVPVTLTVRIMPAALWPGTVHHTWPVWPKTP